jgi:hypothetical protein
VSVVQITTPGGLVLVRTDSPADEPGSVGLTLVLEGDAAGQGNATVGLWLPAEVVGKLRAALGCPPVPRDPPDRAWLHQE